MDDIGDLIYIPIFIALMAFFVVSEFTIVKMREAKIEQFIKEGKRGATSAKKVYTKLEEYLSACQTGITVSAIATGWLGMSFIKDRLLTYLSGLDLSVTTTNIVAGALSFVGLLILMVVFGELIPKIIAIQKYERLMLIISGPLVFFYNIMYPFNWLLNSIARLITRILGIKIISNKKNAHTEEELRMILSESFKNGEINQSEFKYVNNVFDFDNRVAKEIMVPRTEIICLDITSSQEEFLNVIRTEKLTRYPVIDGDKDHILGIINIKELLTGLVSGKKLTRQTVELYIRPVIRVIDSIPIDELLVKMQREQIHMAVLLDEYGGTAGLVTVEDIVEEIVGEIRDEFDIDEIPLIQQIADNHYILDAKVLISEINDLLSLSIDDEDIDTIGGWILTEKFDVRQGDTVYLEDYEFHILEMEDHHIQYIEVKKIQIKHEIIKEKLHIPVANTKVV